MNKILSIVPLFVLFAFSHAQPIDTLWTKIFSNNIYAEGTSGQQTLDGGFVILGFVRNPDNYNDDVWLIKTDSQGNEEWNETFGGSENDRGNSVQQTTDGGYIITGYTESFGNGGFDVWLIKTDSQGNEEWNQTFGGNNDDAGTSVRQTIDGGFIIIGSTGYTCWLIKTDDNGNEIWNISFPSLFNGRSIDQTNDGGFIITGRSESNEVELIKIDEGGNIEWINNIDYNAYFTDAQSIEQTSDEGFIIAGTYGASGGDNLFIIKTDSLGNKDWDITYYGMTDHYLLYSVQQTTDGGYVVTGSGRILLGVAYENHILFLKVDSDGNVVIVKYFSNSNYSAGRSIQQTTDGGYVIVGTDYSRGIWLLKLSPESDNFQKNPEILSIVDISDDQGGNVRLTFSGSVCENIDWCFANNTLLDVFVTDYSIWRYLDEDSWDALGSFNLIQDSIYNYVAPTLCDSTSEGNCLSTFKISAHTNYQDIIYFSGPFSGYSVDNIAPGVPLSLLAATTAEGLILTWQPNFEEDFQYYGIYRSTQSDFLPELMDSYTYATADTSFTDSDVQVSTTYYYRISAFDYSGNESEFSTQVGNTYLSIDDALLKPTHFTLHPTFPNPFNPVTTIRYDLPKPTFVTLTIYDMNGREINQLVMKNQEAGFKSVVWNASESSSGAYFLVMKTTGFSKVEKLMLIK